MRKICHLATLTCLVWTFVLFPTVQPAVAAPRAGTQQLLLDER